MQCYTYFSIVSYKVRSQAKIQVTMKIVCSLITSLGISLA